METDNVSGKTVFTENPSGQITQQEATFIGARVCQNRRRPLRRDLLPHCFGSAAAAAFCFGTRARAPLNVVVFALTDFP